MILFYLFISFFMTLPTEVVTVSIHFQGIKTISGNIRIGIYDSKETFPIEGKQIKGVTEKVESKSQVISFELPAGKKYSIAAFHDKNGNNKMDKNMMGIPSEDYGFSNNARATFSAPSFSDAAVYISKNTKLSIRLE
jgi:uncharacterized protein (DUF2141 family)